MKIYISYYIWHDNKPRIWKVYTRVGDAKRLITKNGKKKYPIKLLWTECEVDFNKDQSETDLALLLTKVALERS